MAKRIVVTLLFVGLSVAPAAMTVGVLASVEEAAVRAEATKAAKAASEAQYAEEYQADVAEGAQQ
jgi:hypothetical protein